jgi:glycosyltransferase involved in cell wall biosynthesis
MLLSIILPVHNQADHIEPIVREYETGLERLSDPHELLLVTNACTDRSPAVCNALAAEFATVRVLHNEERGWGRAVVRGLEAAKGDILCYTNCARTTAQDLLLLLVYATIYPSVVVKANRKIREGSVRRLGSLLYNLECRSLFDLPTWDINGTPKVFPRSYEKLVRLTREDDLIDAEFNVICRREGYPVVEVPIFSNRRHGGKSTTTVASAIRMYTGAYRMWASDPARRNGERR